jgi:hypothetical protein
VKNSNCIIFALRRWFSRGGYIVLRKSNYGWWPHMIWTKDLDTFQEFAPRVHNPNLRCPPLLFRGTIKTTTRERQVANGLKGRIVSTIDKLKKLKVKARVPRERKAPAKPPNENEVKFTDQLKQLELKVLRNGRQIEAMMAMKIQAAGGRIAKSIPILVSKRKKQ